MNKARVIERSVLCFQCGCYGLIPVLGLIPAVLAVVLYQQVACEAAGQWNPAHRLARCGSIFAWAGLVLTTAALGLGLAVVLPDLI
jgi:hypothetical protein